MKLRHWLSLAAIPALAGCASTSTLMINQEGQFADCGTWGVGIFGAAAALIRTQECANAYQSAGYSATGAPPIIGARAVAAGDTPPASPATVASHDGLFKITLPAGWTPLAAPAAQYQLYARNAEIESAVLISSLESRDEQDWEAHAQSLRAKLIDSLSQGIASEVEKIKVGAADALRVEISGALRNGVTLRYLGTAVHAGRKLIWVVAWCADARFSVNRSALENLALGLQL